MWNQGNVSPERSVRTEILRGFWVCLAIWISGASAVHGQNGAAPAVEAPALAVDNVTLQDVDQAVKQVESATDLDEATKTQSLELLSQARRELESAAKRAQETAQYRAWIESAEQDLRQAERTKQQPAATVDRGAYGSAELSTLQQNFALLEQQFAQSERELAAAQAEPQRRLTRKAEISEAIPALRSQLQETEAALAASAAAGEPPLLQTSRRLLLRARKQALTATLTAGETERNAYDAQGDLPRLRIDLAATRHQQVQAEREYLRNLIAQRRQQDAAIQREEAEAALGSVSPPFRPLAQANLDLVDRRLALAGKIREADAERAAAANLLKKWSDDLARMRQRAETVQSETLGRLLIEKNDSLPARTELQRMTTASQKILREFQGELFQLEERRADLANLDVAVQEELTALRRDGAQLPRDADAGLRELLQSEARISDSLLNDANRYYAVRLATLEDQENLANVVQTYRDFIGERVLWVRSSQTVRWRDLEHARDALQWTLAPTAWRAARDQLLTRLTSQPFQFSMVVLALVLSFSYRRPLRHRLQELGDVASRIACRSVRPTLQALVTTAILALPPALVVWAFGWGLRGSTDPLVSALSYALSNLAIPLWGLEFVRLVCVRKGLGDSHFDWPDPAIVSTRNGLLLFELIGLPLLVTAIVFERQQNAEHRGSLGRFALMLVLLVLAIALFRLLRPKNGILAESMQQAPEGWRRLLWSAVLPLAVLPPLALLWFAIDGYTYTAFRLGSAFFNSIGLVAFLVIARATLFRWIRVQRRHLRWNQLVEARSRQNPADGSEMSDLDALAVKAEAVDLAAMDQQARRSIGVLLFVTGLIGFSSIWYTYVPALAPILGYELWSVPLANGGAKPITVGMISIGLLTLTLAILASRNVPGLIDALLLGQLGVDSPTRYAISTLTRYALVLIGVLAACNSIGITWHSAQWLVAALGVGLGFGLQEIVANFICGILLLFERPIRVGDIVTLGETTGVVTRIRSRATTVRNWDRQEVLIPNKELITGRIVNWTLDDQVNRLVFNVGTAYESDPHQVRDVLVKILDENPNVMKDPRPVVTLEQFGDSNLVFIIRAYLSSIDERLETLHQLHTTIHQRFAAQGIEIAFPQRELRWHRASEKRA